MPRRPLASIEIVRARLFDVDVDRKKRIDDAIDYFGTGHIGVARDPCGESLLDGFHVVRRPRSQSRAR
jgi:hypothetical protein